MARGPEGLALLPAQNATGNFVKVVQRPPVRIELVASALRSFRKSISMKPTGPDAGKFLQAYVPPSVEAGAGADAPGAGK